MAGRIVAVRASSNRAAAVRTDDRRRGGGGAQSAVMVGRKRTGDGARFSAVLDVLPPPCSGISRAGPDPVTSNFCGQFGGTTLTSGRMGEAPGLIRRPAA